MRYKFIILFLILGFVSKAQVYQLMPQYGYSTYRMNFDSTIQIPTFCGVPKLGSNKINKGALAFDSCNNRFYFFNPKSQAWDTIKSGSTVDTTKFVRYTDTSSMLLPYLRKGDTIFLSQRIEQRVKYTDTSAMLQPYLKAIDTTNKWVSSVTKLNDSTIQVIKGTTTSNITISSVTSATRLITQVWNNTGATILRGSVVYISGRHSSNLPTIALAEGNNEANSYKTFALVDGDIADNSSGFVIQAGKIAGLNLPTSSYTDGDILYLSPTVAGGYTTTKPLAPNHIVKLGSVTRAHPTQGSIEIKIENGWQLDELSDIQIAAIPADSVLLQFSRVDSLWHDVNPTTAMGNRFVKRTDSAAMLQPYLRKIDTASISNRINLKLNISDTSTMLNPYLRKIDTASLSNRINLKLNISDTATMLNPYLRKIDTTNQYVTSVFRKTASDSVFFVRGGSNNFAFRDSAGGANIYNSNGSLTGARTLTLNSQPLTIAGSTDATSTRFHANGNVTVGGTTFPNTDSAYKFTISGSGNVFKIRMRQGFTGADINFVQSDVYNLISTGNFLQIGSSGGTATFGGGSGSRTNIGCNAQDVVTPVVIGYESWRGSQASAMLDIRSTTRGFLQPRMTTSEMNAISTPATGLSIFNTTDSAVYIRRGTGAGWQQQAGQIFNTASLNFPSTNAQNSSDLTITLTGAVDGDAVVLGVPNAAVNANSCYTAWVSAANTVTVRFNNYSSGAIDPAQATFKVTIIK